MWNPANDIRAGQRKRQKLRPSDPKTLDFILDLTYIGEDFVRADIREEKFCCIVLATNQQLERLSKTIIWYIDGTFKTVKIPFTQLFTIHSFIAALRFSQHFFR